MKNLFFKLPNFIQNTILSIYNSYLYSIRYGGVYKQIKKELLSTYTLSFESLKNIQNKRFISFINFAKENSIFYKKLYKNINLEDIKSTNEINLLPIVTKEQLRASIKDVYTISKKKGIVSKTGGTTGKSLEVLFTKKDVQIDYAQLDTFRSLYGYKLGKKTAWFSGKTLLNETDIKKNRFWKYDFINKVRYYSTFHIQEAYLKYYLNDLIKYKPLYMVGFPSTMVEIAKFGIKNNIPFPKNVINTIFPTAESLTKDIRGVLSNYFNARIADQYASSEGAPLIFECIKGNLHMDIRSGVFEVLDENNKPTNEGRLVVTSFTTHGTPLIRYDIGDSLKLSKLTHCDCGSNLPMVESIHGRINDFVFSPETGKINLGNVSNTLKDVYGIKKFQVIQNTKNKLDIKIIIDDTIFTKKDEEKFIKNWQERVGSKMKLNLNYVTHIDSEKSGKFRLIKNNLKQNNG